jgi:non-specific serine/threonine protein kinase
MHVLGVAAQMGGDFKEAKDVMSRRIALAREKGDLYTISSEGGNLSMVERQLGNLEAAESLAAEALEIDFQSGNEMVIPWKVNGLAAVAAERGELDRAAALIGIADFTLEAAGGAWPPDELAQYERTVAIVTEGLGTAELDRARNAARAMTTAEAVAFALRASEKRITQHPGQSRSTSID